MTVSCGVFLGQLLPNAAIELGQKSFFILLFRAAYKQLNKAPMFNSSVLLGLTSPVADNNAVKQYTSVIWCLPRM